MNLPSTIKIKPLTVPLRTKLTFADLCPGSKSITNRALILAALSKKSVQLRGALASEDTECMVKALRKLGIRIDEKKDSSNTCNRIFTIHGKGGEIPSQKADLYVGTAGTAARFLTAFCSLSSGYYLLHGTPQMHKRPMKELFQALQKLGAEVKDTQGHLPAIVHGPIRPGKVSIGDKDTSQLASALLLIQKISHIKVICPSSPYVELTRHLIKQWTKPSKIKDIEYDASNAGYFLALSYLQNRSTNSAIKGWLKNSMQIDSKLDHKRFWEPLLKGKSVLKISRKTDLGDSVMIMVIAAAALKKPLRLVHAEKLRKQECDRLSALTTELKRCGVEVREYHDGLELTGKSRFKPASINTYNDHRMAMCFAILGCMDVFGNGKPWITIKNPSCVEKTFPNFFDSLKKITQQSFRLAKKR